MAFVDVVNFKCFKMFQCFCKKCLVVITTTAATKRSHPDFHFSKVEVKRLTSIFFSRQGQRLLTEKIKLVFGLFLEYNAIVKEEEEEGVPWSF